ncbi:hypothetical protein SESBI_39001 [Sesbania bispinosa]|nr:hypothetical protein SESBI_39001 [Sesbania bispinosa]
MTSMNRERIGGDREEDYMDTLSFSDNIVATMLPENLRESVLDAFDGTKDPKEHLAIYRTQPMISGANDAIQCKMFLGTLKKSALAWLTNLPDRSIVENPEPKIIVAVFKNGFRVGMFNESLTQRPVQSMSEIPRPTTCVKGPHKDKWCEFHKASEHETEEDCTLKKQIEQLIKRGHLGRYVARQEDNNEQAQVRRKRSPSGGQGYAVNHLKGMISTTVGGFTGGGVTNLTRRRYISGRSVMAVEKVMEGSRGVVITFNDADYDGMEPHRDNPIVVIIRTANFNVRRVMVD